MPNTVQHRRRIGALGAPPTLLQGQLAINDPGGAGFTARLYGGGIGTSGQVGGIWGTFVWGQGNWGGGAGGGTVVTLVSPTRQVELAGDQTITGDKRIDVGLLHINGGAPGYLLATNGVGNLFWTPGDGSLPSPGGSITGDINFTGNVTLNGIPLVADAPTDGRLYVRGNESWVILPWQGGTGGGTGGGDGIPEAPGVVGALYGRSGVGIGSWQPVLPINGGTMQGPLVLDGPPGPAALPNAAATKGYVDSHITGALTYIGTINGSTGVVTYTPTSGFINGPLVSASLAANTFVICNFPGTVPGGPLAGQALNAGDWVISDGTAWAVSPIGGAPVPASSVVVNPAVLGATSAQAALVAVAASVGAGLAEAPTDGRSYLRDGLAEDWVAGLPLAGGTMTGGLVLAGPPTQTGQAATKGYVDLLVAGTHAPLFWGQGDWGADNWGGTGGGIASSIVVAPSVLGQSDVQGALQSLVSYIDAKPAVRVGSVSPLAPADGMLWYDSNNTRLMLYAGAWIQVA